MTQTLIPLAVIDDVIGVVVFFTVISIVNGAYSGSDTSILSIVGMVCFPFIIGIAAGFCASVILKKIKNRYLCFSLLLVFLCLSTVIGLLIDRFVYHSFSLNYLLIGMAFSGTVANMLPEEKFVDVLKLYEPLLNLSLVVVIVNLGMPLDYRLIAGAGLFTAIYILARAAGKIGGAYLGGKIAKADPKVTKYLGFTLLPHSGVSLVFTGIAVSTLTAIDPSLATIISGTIAAAAIINEIIAVIIAKFAFKWAGEMEK